MSRRITSTIFTMALAIVMAILVWIAAIQEENPTITGLYQQRIPLMVIQPTADLVISDRSALPTHVQVGLRGPQSQWQRLALNKFEAILNLSSYEAGIYSASIQVTVTDPQITVESIDPSSVTVQIEPLALKEMPVIVRVTGDPPSGFIYRLPPTPITITVKGPAQAVQAVEQIESQLILNEQRESITRKIRPTPKNNLGETVDNVVLEPNQPEIDILVEQKFGYNNVGVKAIVVGEPASGYFIESISTLPNEVVLRGSDDAPASIETRAIDISGAKADVEQRVPLIIPFNFSIQAEDQVDAETSRSVQVNIKISAFSGGLSVQRKVTVEGVDQNFTWLIEPNTVEVFLSGPWPQLQSLTEEDVTVIVDLFNLEAGIHRLPITIIQPEELEVGSIIPDLVEVTLMPQRQHSPTSTGVITDTITGTIIFTSTQDKATN